MLLPKSDDAEKILEFLANTLTNKFLHQPSTQLRQASQDNRDHILDIAQKLFLNNDTDDKQKDSN
jgi:glutamyl-tRNA reductase